MRFVKCVSLSHPSPEKLPGDSASPGVFARSLLATRLAAVLFERGVSRSSVCHLITLDRTKARARGGYVMSELNGDDLEFDQATCPFCGTVYTCVDYKDYMDCWAPTECMHPCCATCAIYVEKYGVCMCPIWAKEEGPECQNDHSTTLS